MRFLKIHQNDGCMALFWTCFTSALRVGDLPIWKRSAHRWHGPRATGAAVPFWLGVSSHDDAFGLKYPATGRPPRSIQGGEGEKTPREAFEGEVGWENFGRFGEVVLGVCQLGMWNLKWPGFRFLIWSFCLLSACKAVVFHALIVLGEFFTSGFMWNICFPPLVQLWQSSWRPKTKSPHKFCLHMIHLRRTQNYFEMHSPYLAPQKTNISPGKWWLLDCFSVSGKRFFSGYVNLQSVSLSRFQCTIIWGTRRRGDAQRDMQHTWILFEIGFQWS